MPEGGRRACRAVLTQDFDDLQGDREASYRAVIFNPVPGPPMGKNTRLSFRYKLHGTDTLRVQLYSLSNNYHRYLSVGGLPQDKWQSATVDMTQMRRPDGSGGPLSADERIDDIQFYIDPRAELLIDDVVLYDAAVEGEQRPFPKRILFTGWFDTGKQGAEWPGEFEIVAHEKPRTWKFARSIADRETGQPKLVVDLRGPRRLSAVTELTFKYKLTGGDSLKIELVDREGNHTAELGKLKCGEWSEATVRFDLPAGEQRERFTTAVRFLPPAAAVLEIDDLLLYEPGEKDPAQRSSAIRLCESGRQWHNAGMISHLPVRFVALTAFLVLLGACAPRPAPVPTGNQKETGGNSATTAAGTSTTKPAADYTASEILQRLLATYRKAQSYQDQAVVRLSFQQGDQPVNEEFPAAVAFERPNKLSLTAYQATVKSDGDELRARIDDPDTGHVDNQVVVRPAPKELKLSDLASDQLLYDILSSQLRRQPIQLELLLESGGLVSAFSADVACQRLPDEQQEGEMCFRVEVPSPGGPFVFWIDQDDFLLRRLDYPAGALVPDLVNDPAVKDVRLYADLRGAKLGAKVPASEFALEIPAGTSG